jgi:hypothetical protein
VLLGASVSQRLRHEWKSNPDRTPGIGKWNKKAIPNEDKARLRSALEWLRKNNWRGALAAAARQFKVKYETLQMLRRGIRLDELAKLGVRRNRK